MTRSSNRLRRWLRRAPELRPCVDEHLSIALGVLADPDIGADNDAVEAMIARGLPAIVAEKLVVLVPEAFALVFLGHFGVKRLPSSLLIRSGDGKWRKRPLNGEPCFAEAIVAATTMIHQGPRGVFETVSQRSATLNALNRALWQGASTDDIEKATFSGPCVVRLTAEEWEAEPSP